MMNCDTCAERLDEYVLGELTPSTQADVASHLDSCSTCREELAACRLISATLRQLRRYSPGAAACLRVSEAIHAGIAPPRRAEYGPVLDFAELAEYLHVNPETLEHYVGDIPCFELGGRLLFRRVKVAEWIARRETILGIESERPAMPDRNEPVNVMKGEPSWILSQRN